MQYMPQPHKKQNIYSLCKYMTLFWTLYEKILMEALYSTDENLTVVLNISQGFSFSVFLKFGETFLFGFCRSSLNGFENQMNFKKIKICLVIHLLRP